MQSPANSPHQRPYTPPNLGVAYTQASDNIPISLLIYQSSSFPAAITLPHNLKFQSCSSLTTTSATDMLAVAVRQAGGKPYDRRYYSSTARSMPRPSGPIPCRDIRLPRSRSVAQLHRRRQHEPAVNLIIQFPIHKFAVVMRQFDVFQQCFQPLATPKSVRAQAIEV